MMKPEVKKEVAEKILKSLQPLRRWGFEVVERDEGWFQVRRGEKKWDIFVKEAFSPHDAWIECPTLWASVVSPNEVNYFASRLIEDIVLDVISPNPRPKRVGAGDVLWTGSKVWRVEFHWGDGGWEMSLWRAPYEVEERVRGSLRANPIKAYAKLVRRALSKWESQQVTS